MQQAFFLGRRESNRDRDGAKPVIHRRREAGLKAAAARRAKAAADDGAETTGRRRGRGFTAVYEDLREDIHTLRLAPGTALDEVALAKRFGLSRTPIREALLMLSQEDLVSFLQGRSAIVTPHTMSNMHEYMDSLMLLTRAIMRLAAEMHIDASMNEIRNCQVAYEAIAGGEDVHAIVAADLAFHRAISVASGNEFLGKFYRLSLDYGRRLHLLHYYPLFGPAERETCIAEHAGMVEALERGDAERSEELASQHVLSELKVVQRSLEPKMGSRFGLDKGWRAPGGIG
jgi:DNA-binding GntR family transcriptional regulator